MILIDKKLFKVTSFVLYKFLSSYYYYIVLLSFVTFLFLTPFKESCFLLLFFKVLLLSHIYFGLMHLVEDYVFDRTLVIFFKIFILIISYIYFSTFILYGFLHLI